jgi:hypothetical protein
MKKNMHLFTIVLTIVFTALFAAAPLSAGPKNTKGGSSFPEIYEVFYDADLSTLTISGNKFDPNLAEVRLGSSSSAPLLFDFSSSSSDLLVVDVTGVTDGDYTLTVTQGDDGKQFDQFDLTIGTAGPQGEQGPAGSDGQDGFLSVVVIESDVVSPPYSTEVFSVTCPPESVVVGGGWRHMENYPGVMAVRAAYPEVANNRYTVIFANTGLLSVYYRMYATCVN